MRCREVRRRTLSKRCCTFLDAALDDLRFAERVAPGDAPYTEDVAHALAKGCRRGSGQESKLCRELEIGGVIVNDRMTRPHIAQASIPNLSQNPTRSDQNQSVWSKLNSFVDDANGILALHGGNYSRDGSLESANSSQPKPSNQAKGGFITPPEPVFAAIWTIGAVGRQALACPFSNPVRAISRSRMHLPRK